MPPIKKPSSLYNPSTVKPVATPVKATPVPPVKPKPVEPNKEAVTNLHREGDAPKVNAWHAAMKKLLPRITNEQSTDLIAVGVKMSEADRNILLRVLQANL